MTKLGFNCFNANALRNFICLSFLIPTILGCGQRKSEFTPLANGFGYVIVRGGIDQAPGEELHYRGPDGKDTLIWDNVVAPIKITNDMAVFAGERPVGSKPGAPVGYLERRLFAVRAPGPVVDITSQVFAVGVKRQRAYPEGSVPSGGFVDLKQNSSELVAEYTIGDPKNPDLDVKLTWDEVSELLRK